MNNENLKCDRQLRSARARRAVTAVPSLRMALVPALVLFDGVAVVPAPVVAVVLPFSAALALLAGEGAVRTTVAVSLRGTACCVAFAASCGLTPRVVVGAEAFGAGAAVCAETLATVSVNTAARGMTLMKGFIGPALVKRGGNNTNKRVFESCNLQAESTIKNRSASRLQNVPPLGVGKHRNLPPLISMFPRLPYHCANSGRKQV